jgi:hypothetical protein
MRSQVRLLDRKQSLLAVTPRVAGGRRAAGVTAILIGPRTHAERGARRRAPRPLAPYEAVGKIRIGALRRIGARHGGAARPPEAPLNGALCVDRSRRWLLVQVGRVAGRVDRRGVLDRGVRVRRAPAVLAPANAHGGAALLYAGLSSCARAGGRLSAEATRRGGRGRAAADGHREGRRRGTKPEEGPREESASGHRFACPVVRATSMLALQS